jgi:structural maintenance of chromosome 4
LEQFDQELAEFTGNYESKKKKLSKLQNAELDLTNQLDTLNQSLQQNQSALTVCQDRLKDFQQKKAALFEFDPELASPLKTLSEEELPEVDIKATKSALAKLQEKLKSLKPNMGAIAEYRTKQQECAARTLELEELTKKRDDQQALCERLRKKRLDEFMAGFSIIKRKLKEMYRMITLTGDAELEFVDSIDPFSEGIVFSVRPPKKSWKNIANLSGGEKVRFWMESISL